MLPTTYKEFKLFYRKVIAYAAITSLTITPAVSFSVPQGGVIAVGSGDIRADGNTLTVSQHTPKAVINWQEFDIGEAEGVVFNQPDGGIALNRIHDADSSRIDGSLTANGQVMLINPNGMVFGKNSKVDVGGMLATTADISNDDFMAGNYRFATRGNADARIINHGTITAKQGGGIALVAPGVENHGTIQANLGKVQLGGADTLTLDMHGDGLIVYDVTDSLKDQFVNHSGKINAQGGIVTLTTAAADSVIDSSINISGDINVSNALGDAGIVIAQAGTHTATGKNGTVLVSGKINASGNKGGAIHILGDRIGLDAGAKLDATGTRGGGEVLVGGDYLGGKYTGTVKPERARAGGNSTVQAGKSGKLLESYHTNRGGIQKARKVYMDKEASIDVSAKHSGDAGRAILWSDEQTKFYGSIMAMGGKSSGDGGFVETSSKEILTAIGMVDASALKGNAGTWLLDPNNITISTGADGANTNISTTVGSPTRFDTTTDGSILTTGSIEAALNGGTSVTIETQNGGSSSEAGTITFANNITKSTGSNATLLVRAADSIVLNTGVQIVSNAGALNVTMHADKDNSGQGAFAMSTGSGIFTNGGTITIGGGLDPTTNGARSSVAASLNPGVSLTGATLDAQGGNISIIGQGRDFAAGSALRGVELVSGTTVKTSGTGNITIRGTGGVGANNNTGVLVDGAGTKVEAVDGAIDVTGNGSASSAGNNLGVVIQNGAVIEQTGTSATTGNVRVRGTGGAGTTGNVGVLIQNSGTRVSSRSGDILVTGNSNGTSTENYGVQIQSGAVIESTGTTSDAASVTIEGTAGGSGVSNQNHGIFVDSNTIIRSINGHIVMNGTSPTTTGNSSNGIHLDNSSRIESTGAANIILNGTSAFSSIGVALGVALQNSSTIRSMGSGAITISGTSRGTAGGYNHGIYSDNSTIRTDGTGNITMTGVAGGSGADATGFNVGIRVANNAEIRSTLAQTNPSIGTISLNGTGGTSSAAGIVNTGIYIGTDNGPPAFVNSEGGNIVLNGTSGIAPSGFSSGVVMGEATTSSILANRNANITITGTGRATGANSFGVGIMNSNLVRSENGNITITGNGSAASTVGSSHGVRLVGSTVQSTGTGNISVTGNGGGAGASVNNYGVFLNGGTIRTVSGTKDITARAGTGSGVGNIGFFTSSLANAIGDVSTTGNVTLTFDSYVFDNFSGRTTGTWNIRPLTDTTSIGLAGGAGGLTFSSVDLDKVTAGNFTIGRTDGKGAITANAKSWNSPVTLVNGDANIHINGLQTMGARTFVANTNGSGDVVLGAAGGISSSAAGNNIILASGRNFINNSLLGAGTLSTGGGNFLIYSTSPSNDSVGTLTSNYTRYSCTYLGSCPSLGTGNGFLYRSAAPSSGGGWSPDGWAGFPTPDISTISTEPPSIPSVQPPPSAPVIIPPSVPAQIVSPPTAEARSPDFNSYEFIYGDEKEFWRVLESTTEISNFHSTQLGAQQYLYSPKMFLRDLYRFTREAIIVFALSDATVQATEAQ